LLCRHDRLRPVLHGLFGDLKDPAIGAEFDADGDGKADLAGCVFGWGCERVIEHHLTEYGLRDTVTHNQSEYNALMVDRIARFENGKPILYFTWTPYWFQGHWFPAKITGGGHAAGGHLFGGLCSGAGGASERSRRPDFTQPDCRTAWHFDAPA
jgi:ABC-type proline/glycine betaine transport system substrate-binding protein